MSGWKRRLCSWHILSCLGLVMAVCGGCVHPLQRTWQTYRDAKECRDYETAGRYLADDARIWFDKKEGPGAPLTAKGGPYAEWDGEFHSKSTREHIRVVGRTLTYLTSEINDFYRLLERVPTKARVTYYFTEEGLISGMLYQGLSPRRVRPPDRFAEFKLWAAGKYPGLLDSDDMQIPNQPQRWRELLTEFRADVGLPPIE